MHYSRQVSHIFGRLTVIDLANVASYTGIRPVRLDVHESHWRFSSPVYSCHARHLGSPKGLHETVRLSESNACRRWRLDTMNDRKEPDWQVD